MSKVQRVPRPLLGLLGIVGDNPPQSLNDEYRGSIEMLPMVIAEVPLEEQFTTNAAAAQGGIATSTVPANEVWFVEGVQATTVLDGTVAQIAGISVRWNGGHLNYRCWVPSVSYAASAGSTVTDGFNAANGQPIIARAGSTFRARVDTLSGVANVSLTLGLAFRRIPV